MEQFGFHPVIRSWFESKYAAATEPQRQGWPAILAGRHTLIAAPTGSGKTLAAFLACMDRLVRRAVQGRLEPGVRVVYVSPLRALSNDMQRNLQQPLAEIQHLAQQSGLDASEVRIGLRTGDTSPSQRQALVRKPPHILVTTPESLYLLLTGPRSRDILRTVDTLIVDEIHALIRDKRGSHLALSMERLESLTGKPLQRIGLSATQKPIDGVARYLTGNRQQVETFDVGNQPQQAASCQIVDVGYGRELDLGIETPATPLEAVCSHEQWAELYNRLVELIRKHRSTLVFVNTRRMAERVTHQLTELLGEDAVSSHHGSLSAERRLRTEQRLKSGDLTAVVATASLELGLDVGYIDLVVQIGSPRSIATLLQRVGRSGHSLGLTPKGRLFALTRGELLECLALIRSIALGELDTTRIPRAPLDILAQQIVAEVACREWDTTELFHMFRRASPYADLARTDFDRTVRFLSEGIVQHSGRSRVYLHHDHVQQRLRARKSARISATSNGGAIPETGAFRVVTDPEGTVVGSLDEDFAIESQRGDVFLLGNTSWRILHVRGGDVTVADAQGAPPSVPFWHGESPGRTLELSEQVSRLRSDIADRLDDPSAAVDWLVQATGVGHSMARQAVDWIDSQRAAIGIVPTQQQVVFERFFDETGGMQLVVHAPFGSAINRAWGFALRKRFCRSFDFELQATADDDGFILSLGPQHSFPIESLFAMLNADNAAGLLEQAVLTVPMFQIRWRWNVTRALLVQRMRNGKKVPPALQRFRSDDLLTAVFPKLTGCQEEHTGDHQLPNHPLAQQTMHDCLHEALDLDGLLQVLKDVASGHVQCVARDTREPSPFCYELLNSNPYTFLDGGEIQERRTRAVATRRGMSIDSADDLGHLDPRAIEQVCREAQPLIRDADELHDALLSRIMIPTDEAPDCDGWFRELKRQGRAATLTLPDQRTAWVSAERFPAARALFPNAAIQPDLAVPASVPQSCSTLDARLDLLRGLMEVAGPVTCAQLSRRLSIAENLVEATLQALEGEGVVLRGRFTHGSFEQPQREKSEYEWCHRRLLARIHRLTLRGLREQIQPVNADVFIRFLAEHHGLSSAHKRGGVNGVYEVISLLQGLDLPAACWESDVLPGRVASYQPAWLDELCLSGEVGWGRLNPRKQDPKRSQPVASLTRVTPVALWLRQDCDWLTRFLAPPAPERLSGCARDVLERLAESGALFAGDLLSSNSPLPDQLQEALGELVALGLLTSDGINGLRQLISDKHRGRRATAARSRLIRRRTADQVAGRWSVWRTAAQADCSADGDETDTEPATEQWAWQLLRRWGVVFRDLMIREPGAPRWYELLRVYRRLEARGEIRGGRFIAGVGGEQFALSETVKRLRQLKTSDAPSELLVLSAADPLNLVGILTARARIPSLASNRVAYLDGRPVAALQSRTFIELEPLNKQLARDICRRMQCGTSGGSQVTGASDQLNPTAESHLARRPDAVRTLTR